MTELDDQAEVASESDGSDNDSIISDIDLDDFDDDLDFELNFPKNNVCAAHTLQLVLKDVFENCIELNELNQVWFLNYNLYDFTFRKCRRF